MFPEETALEFTRQEADNVLKAKDLMDLLKLEVESRERTANLTQKREGYQYEERYAGGDKEHEKEYRMRRPYTGTMVSATAFHTWSSNDNSDYFVEGLIINDDHGYQERKAEAIWQVFYMSGPQTHCV